MNPTDYTEKLQEIKRLVDDAKHIVIIQADNPDSDSLGSALALEEVLSEYGKTVTMYCGVDMPGYLRYMQGWDRVESSIPKQFDASILVDASTTTLLERLSDSKQDAVIATRPCIVLDHHETVENTVPYATVIINDYTRSSTGELIYAVSDALGWPMTVRAQEFMLSAILGDTQGLSNQLASPATYRIVADMLDDGVNRVNLEELRREYNKMPPEIFKYKARLIDRTEFASDGKVAILTIPQSEINAYSPLYNPAPLIQGDILQTSGVAVAIVLKSYDDGRITGAIRSNNGYPVAGELAKELGGGGHAYASGFKNTSGRPINEVKSECINRAIELLAKLDTGTTDETAQHTYQTN
jgi:phosphoesterase RecJ-like protein